MTMLKKERKEQGLIDEAANEGIDLKSEIRRMCKEKDAIILAHYYTVGDIQDIADFVGDSLALARKAAETDARMMVMCGVHFMAETCKLLSPEKTVLCPDLNAGCSLADSCKAEDLKKFKDEHPGYQVISYVNTTAAVKALTDVVVTSGNAKKVVEVDMQAKGTPLHDASVVGDTVGDPFKDTSSVALNPIIKFTTLFGVLAMEIAISEGFRGMAPWFGVAFLIVALVFVYRSFYKMRIK